MLFKSNLILSRRSQNRLATTRLVSSWDFFIRPRVLTRFTPYNTRQVTMRYGVSPLVASQSLKLSSFVLYLYITTLLVLNARTYS
jgi:ligand-binding SRPBCC domain-containing protein